MVSETYEYQSDFARRYFGQGEAKGKAKGKVEGMAEALLTALVGRGIHVPDPTRKRITECADGDLLDTWIRRAANASTIDDLFAQQSGPGSESQSLGQRLVVNVTICYPSGTHGDRVAESSTNITVCPQDNTKR